MKILVLIVAMLGMCSMSHAGFYKTDYEIVPVSSTQTLGPVGGAGDQIERLIITVITAATGTVRIQDGAASTVGYADITQANTPIGVYSVDLGGVRSVRGAWNVTTGAGASVMAVGSFK